MRQPLVPGMTAPLVDIGMPAYLRPHFIAEAIESVLAQTHTDWRLFVSENGRGGGDVEAVVRRYADDARITSRRPAATSARSRTGRARCRPAARPTSR